MKILVFKIKEKIRKVLDCIVNVNNNYKHFLTFLALAFSFFISNYRLEKVTSHFEKREIDIVRKFEQKEKEIMIQIAECTTTNEENKRLKKEKNKIALELDTWKIAAFMHSAKYPKDTLFLKVVEALIEPLEDSLFISPKDFKNGY